MLKKIFISLYKVFFVGLLLQFLLQTFVMFKLGIDAPWMKYVWLWKEGIIALLLLLSFIGIVREKKWKQIFSNTPIGRWTWVLVLSILVSILVHFQILHL